MHRFIKFAMQQIIWEGSIIVSDGAVLRHIASRCVQSIFVAYH